MNVDVNIPAISQTYEFDLNGEKTIYSLIEELSESICQKEHCETTGTAQQFLLLHKETKRILSADQTLMQAGVHNADTLILI